ncbi:MAG: hypothetical protein LBQ74_12990 [Prevotella sp.]|jgi:hypothetical protein|nr:hypothetical protein [Prevotella sp.]
MKSDITFSELNQLDTEHLKDMLAVGKLTDENKRRIEYEIRVRGIQLPKEYKLKN